jgi:alpha-maltose-1-phosphate synthase
MKIAILTNEYPPNTYGGAGVHVEYLVREMAALTGDDSSIEVFSFGEQQSQQENLRIHGIDRDLHCSSGQLRHPQLLKTLIREAAMTCSVASADIIHCHTWYTHLAGCLLRQLTGGRLILTTHSLEPHRPWKKEQLGAAYAASSWMEKTAYENADGVIAVSRAMKDDVRELYHVPDEKIKIIHNGIDIREYRHHVDPDVLKRYGISIDKPFILFVGRITRQKGILHLVNAIPFLESDIQVVLCAGKADTEELEQEMAERITRIRETSGKKIVWIPETVPRPEIISLYSAASLFVCPSIYEPFGIINLEAMACGTPVVASSIGGIPEIVLPGETGRLVPFETRGGDNPEPAEPERFSRDLASTVDSVLRSRDEMRQMGINARKRIEEHFSWSSIARQTIDFYRTIVSSSPGGPVHDT